jgi:hypothetical protein
MGCLRSMYEKHKAAMLPLRDNEKGLKKYIEEQREILSGYRRVRRNSILEALLSL